MSRRDWIVVYIQAMPFFQVMHSLGINPMTLVLLEPRFTVWAAGRPCLTWWCSRQCVDYLWYSLWKMTVAVRPTKLHRCIVFLVCAVKWRHIQHCMACTHYTGGGSEWRFILSSSELTCLCVLCATLRRVSLLPAFHPTHAFPHHFKAAHRNCMLYFV